MAIKFLSAIDHGAYQLPTVDGSNGQVLTTDGNGNVTFQSVAASSNYYLSGASFNTGNGILTLTVTGASNQTVDLDGRYALSNHSHNYDNYQSWNLKTNGTQRTTVQSGGDLNLVAGSNVSLSYSAGGTVTIASSYTETDTLATVTSRGSSTTSAITTGGITATYGWFGGTGTAPQIRIFTENASASIADTFADTSTDKSYIHFLAGTNSNDPGYIMHETSESVSPDERNEGVLHLVPSDDNSFGDYVSIHGTNDPDCVKIHTNGMIETSSTYQLVLRSGNGYIRVDDGLSVAAQINTDSHGDSSQWNTAYSWGNHASAGYLTSYTDTNDIDYINAASFNTGNGILSLTGVGNAGASVDLDGRYLPLSGGTLTGNLTLNSATPEILFNGTSDAGVDMAIKATPEGLDFYEPEDSNKIHFQILDDTGVNAAFGLKVGGTSVISSSRVLQNVSGNISMFTNDAGYLTSYTDTNDIDYVNAATFNTSNGVITGTGVGNAGFTVDIDGRYLLRTTDTFTGALTINGYIKGNGQELILSAGESHSVATGQTDEFVYINAEGGLQVNSSPDNWASGWAGRKTTTINDTSGNSTFAGALFWSGGGSAESNAAYDNMITAAAVSGTTTKTLTLTQQDGGTVTASWTDTNSIDYISSASFNTGNGILSLSGVGNAGASVDLDGRYQLAGTYNTIIGTDSDINTSGATVIDQLNMTDGVITSHSTRTLTAANLGITQPDPPTLNALNIVGETIEVVFDQSPTPDIDKYEIWSSVSGGSYGLIATIPKDDVAPVMTTIDAAFSVSGTQAYRVYAVKNGIYSVAATGSTTFNTPSLSVVNMSVINLNPAYYIQYDLPDSRFIDHIEIYMDAETTSSSLSRTGASLIYSGSNSSYMYQIGASDLDKFHQFWVEVVAS